MIKLGDRRLNLVDIEDIVYNNMMVALSDNAAQKISLTYERVKQAAAQPKPIYGINTGFGALAETIISPSDQALLQQNIILSHAVGVGAPLDFYCAKTLILLRLNTLVQAHSGASPTLIHHLLCLLNANCAPLVPKKGSVGASGDLAPLAHLGLLLLGLGDAMINNHVVSAEQALHHAKLVPITLGVRDGLALINGTQAMGSVALNALKQARFLEQLSDIAAASSLDALGGHATPFDTRIHALKPHHGQTRTAHLMQNLIRGRTVEQLYKNPLTQDPYSLRCVPQVHGATKDVITQVHDVIITEINAVTDNPLFFFNEDMSEFDSVSGGNFHGQHLALALDYLAMGIAELANISERRLELMLNHHHSNGLPPFLIDNSGINSGFMMLQVTASALVNENKVLCHPASVDSIPTSANREDHVSMGMTSANKLVEVITNTKTVLAIELLAAHQGLDFRPKDSPGLLIQKFHQALRAVIPFRKHDGLYGHDLQQLMAWLESKETHRLINDMVII